MKRPLSRFSYMSTEMLLGLTAPNSNQTTAKGTDYSHRMSDTPQECDAHHALWKRQALYAVKALTAHQAALESWEDFLDSQGVPPIPTDYWDKYFTQSHPSYGAIPC